MSGKIKAPKYPILDEIDVPGKVIENWQITVDLLSKISNTPSALIMRVHAEDIEVFVSSHSAGNVYHVGERSPLNFNLYCETVMNTRNKLLVPNALQDPLWDKNPDIALGMISYCGLPVTWPGGQIFGTICILDKQENACSQLIFDLMERFRDSIQLSLIGIYDAFVEKKQVKESLRGAQEFIQQLIASANVMIVGLDSAGRVKVFNHAAENITGYTIEELAGINWFEKIVPQDRYAYVWEMFRNSQQYSGAMPTTFENPILTKSGEERFISWQNSPISTPSAEISTLSFGLDITERKRAEEELQKLYGELEQRIIERTADLSRAQAAYRQANRKLNLLSGITRHDIRNQLLVLEGYLEISKESLHNPDRTAEFIAKEQRIAETIGRQITFTKDYENMGVKAPAWQKVHTIVNEVITRLPMRDIRVDAGDSGLEVFADLLLEKVFYNLIDNSLHYGGDKMTIIHVTASELAEGLQILYEDDGDGISDEDKTQLFTKGFGKHTGLGLFLSREILSITGITISENGEPGKGARFEMTVPKGGYRFTGGA